MEPIEEVDATTARRKLRSMIDRAHVRQQPTAITRHGEIVAVVIPVRWYEHLVSGHESQLPGDVTLLPESCGQ